MDILNTQDFQHCMHTDQNNLHIHMNTQCHVIVNTQIEGHQRPNPHT